MVFFCYLWQQIFFSKRRREDIEMIPFLIGLGILSCAKFAAILAPCCMMFIAPNVKNYHDGRGPKCFVHVLFSWNELDHWWHTNWISFDFICFIVIVLLLVSSEYFCDVLLCTGCVIRRLWTSNGWMERATLFTYWNKSCDVEYARNCIIFALAVLEMQCLCFFVGWGEKLPINETLKCRLEK